MVLLESVHLVRRSDYRLTVKQVFFLLGHEIRAGFVEALHRVGRDAIEHADCMHYLFQGALELPAFVCRVVVVRGYKDRNVLCLRSFEQLFDIFDGLVRGNRIANQTPCNAVWAQEVDFRVSDDNWGVVYAKTVRELMPRFSATES